MKSKNLLLLIFCSVIIINDLMAQDKSNVKFGKIDASDFNLTAEKFDSGANAMIIADIGSTSFEGNDKGSFTLVFTRLLRVKIMNKNGFDIGKRTILLYHNTEGDIEKINGLKGSTFNLENGRVSETRLDDKSVFTEKYNKNYDQLKFSLPALKEGAIFDLTYTIRSPFDTELKSWTFQGEYPRLWSEYEVTIPPCYHYMMKMQGDQQFDVNTTKEIIRNYSIREESGTSQTPLYNISGSALNKRWVKKNVPALHEEPFTTTIDNYATQVSFQLNYFQWTNESERYDHMITWTTRSKALLEEENFGHALNFENGWMSDELNEILAGSGSAEDKAHKIFCYIRDNFTCSGAGLYTQNSLKSVFKNRQGNVAEINLLLTAMLRKAGIEADPMILSTRDNGIANTSYPLINEYNYVVCVAYINGKVLKLDASEPFNGFDRLPVSCYNGWGHIINEQKPLPMQLIADSVNETSFVNVLMFNDENGKSSGSFKNVTGKSESYNIREEIKQTSVKDYEKKIRASKGSGIEIQKFEIDSLNKYDFPLTINYEFDFKKEAGTDILYFDPMFGEQYKTNPFKSVDRHYPVEIPYLLDETYMLTMDIPAGYQIDELPKSARVAYNDREGLFEYLIQKGEGNIQMRVHLKLNKALFPVDEYTTLRDFFAFVVKKENEQIVFKKIK
jgi:Domain of Unknown Function with PDB structure (DUF3858)/Transglutaminase-like superfamily